MSTKEYEKWADELPKAARESALSHPADKIYRMSSTGHRVRIMSYADDGSVTVAVTKELNLLRMERAVFGISVSQLTECDPPDENEQVGVRLDEEEQLKLINNLRLGHGLPPAATLDELRIKNRVKS